MEPPLFEFSINPNITFQPVYPDREAYEEARRKMCERVDSKLLENAKAHGASLLEALHHPFPKKEINNEQENEGPLRTAS